MAGIQKATKGSALADIRVEALTRAALTCNTREQFADEIGRLWRVSQEAFLRIGQYLLAAKRTLPHGEYEIMIRRDLPFQSSMARKLKAIAEFMEAKKLPPEQIPVTYSAVYEIVSMSDEERSEALSRNLIRPDTSMREFLAFKREVRQTKLPPIMEDEEVVRAELERLYRQRNEILERIAELEQRLGIGQA